MNKKCMVHFLSGVAAVAVAVTGALAFILWTVFCGFLFSYLFGVDKEFSIIMSFIINGLVAGGLMEAEVQGCFKRE